MYLVSTVPTLLHSCMHTLGKISGMSLTTIRMQNIPFSQDTTMSMGTLTLPFCLITHLRMSFRMQTVLNQAMFPKSFFNNGNSKQQSLGICHVSTTIQLQSSNSGIIEQWQKPGRNGLNDDDLRQRQGSKQTE